jgi:hypothetical protein
MPWNHASAPMSSMRVVIEDQTDKRQEVKMFEPIRPNRPSAKKRGVGLESIDIPLSSGSLRSYQGWAKRASPIGGPARDYIRFATWL